MCGVSRGIFFECVQQLAAENWIGLNYATQTLSRGQVWRKFSQDHRDNRHNYSKLSMPKFLSPMAEATVS